MKTSTDVANRALQNCGASYIADGALWTEDSKNANEIRNCYDSLRRAELRRNVWRFAVRRIPLRPISNTTYKIVPATYSATATYLANTIVIYDGVWFISMRNIPVGVAPLTSADWEAYFGPVTVTPFDSASSYFAGELVYTPASNGYSVYLSTENNNSDTPGTVPAWDTTVTYGLGQSVSHSSVNYVSHLILNVGNTPGAVADWAVGTTYAAAATVVAGDGNVYSSVAGSNVGNDPVADTAHTYWTYVSVSPWITVPSSQVGINEGKWQTINATLEPLNFIYPAGVVSGTDARNIFILPSGFMREAPADPKAGSVSFLGAPTGLTYNDWEFENNYFITRETGPIILRCVVDVMDVDKFDTMFYEGLACRIGLEICEAVTQSGSKLATLAGKYKTFMGEARIVNGIETGPTEPPEDDLITCRQ